MLQDRDIDVRKTAARVLGRFADIRTVNALIPALKDEASEVRTQAAMSLGHIGDDRAVEALIQALKSNDGQLRWAAAEALGEIGDQRAVPHLSLALKDPLVGVRSKAQRSLETLRQGPAQAKRETAQSAPSLNLADPGLIKAMAIGSLVLSIIAIPASITGCGLLFPFFSIILGLISFNQATKKDGMRFIRLMALAGTILGFLLVIVLAILVVAALVYQNS
jgi:hypothetical protein